MAYQNQRTADVTPIKDPVDLYVNILLPTSEGGTKMAYVPLRKSNALEAEAIEWLTDPANEGRAGELFEFRVNAVNHGKRKLVVPAAK